jgi:ABC-type dipeptide/oligopeptide/nickel transport system permease component
MGVNLLVSAVVIGANLLTDLAYCLIDPRISYK